MALADKYIAYWKLDESSGNAADSVGSLTLTNNNSAAYVAGKINNGIDLESGSSQYLSATDPAILDGLSKFSISLWLKFESIADDMMPVTKWGATLATNQAWRLITSGGKLQLVIGTGSASGTVTANQAISTGVWYHVAFTWDGSLSSGSRAKAYVDGSDVTLSDGTPATMLAGSADFIVGNRTGLPSGGYYDGVVDELGIANDVVTGAEVTTLYNAGAGVQYPFTAPPSVPTVDTLAVTSITDTTATGNGEITDIGSGDATARGFVFGTSTLGDPGDVAPTSSGYDDYTTESGTFGAATFTGSLTGLTASTTYYVRAWAQNGDGYAYGDEVSFSTSATPPFRFTNLPGTVYDATDTQTIYAERLNDILERLEALE